MLGCSSSTIKNLMDLKRKDLLQIIDDFHNRNAYTSIRKYVDIFLYKLSHISLRMKFHAWFISV